MHHVSMDFVTNIQYRYRDSYYMGILNGVNPVQI